MAKKEKQAPAGLDPNGWMVTFSDLVTLLLTFFVMLLSMSTMNVKKVQQTMESFTAGGGVLEMAAMGRIESYEKKLQQLTKMDLADLIKDKLLDQVKNMKARPGAESIFGNLEDSITVRVNDKSVALIFGTKILFKPGSSELLPQSYPLIGRTAQIIRQVSRAVSVEGHTDSAPLSGRGEFKSNWDLSLHRALAVWSFMVDRLGADPLRMRVAGMADARPIASNDTPEGRAQNRRIEIVFSWQK